MKAPCDDELLSPILVAAAAVAPLVALAGTIARPSSFQMTFSLRSGTGGEGKRGRSIFCKAAALDEEDEPGC